MWVLKLVLAPYIKVFRGLWPVTYSSCDEGMEEAIIYG